MLDQLAPVHPQIHVFAFADFFEPEVFDQAQHPGLDLVGIDGFLEQFIERCKLLQDWPPLSPGIEVERFGARKQVLDVV